MSTNKNDNANDGKGNVAKQGAEHQTHKQGASTEVPQQNAKHGEKTLGDAMRENERKDNK